jgi:subtilisin family serine protease
MIRKTPGVKSRTIPSIPTYPDGKEYIVSLKPDVDYDAFWDEIEKDSNGDGHIPSRPVRFINERVLSKRSCHYVLNDAEAVELRKDVRVASVVIPAAHLGFKPQTTAVQNGNFNKPADDSVSTGNKLNYGLVRHNSTSNNYGTTVTAPNGYTYTLDGSDVDVVIMDTGIQTDHPEFQNSEGGLRIIAIDWYIEAGMSGTMPSDFYTDIDGHGTHVAGTVAGKTFGWAKNSAIYSMKLDDLSSDSTGINTLQAFDLIIGWHRNKMAISDGQGRPTIVNMSWGYGGEYEIMNIIGGSYRGTNWPGTGYIGSVGNNVHPEYGMGEYGTFSARFPEVDSILEEMIDAGIHVCIAAGNDGVKIDLPSGPDYNNYFISDLMGTFSIFYNRGSSPYSTRAINVGCLDLSAHSVQLDKKAEFSEGGPGVDLYACGYAIYSAASNVNTFTLEGYSDAAYYLDGDFRQGCISGTSMASPQVCGLGALALQLNPYSKPEEFKTWLMNNAAEAIAIFSLAGNDYTNLNSLWGGAPKVLFNKFNSDTSLTIKTVQPEPFVFSP